MNTGPERNPDADSFIEPRTPGLFAILMSIAVAMISGGMVFFGTCLGSTYVTMNYLFSHERPWAILVLWGSWAGSGLLGLTVTFIVGRRMYRRAKQKRS